MVLKRLKRVFNRNKRKPSFRKRYRKRKFLVSVGLALVLVCGRPGLVSAKSSGQNQNNLLAHERVIQNNELTIYDSEKPILHHQNVVNELRGGVNWSEIGWIIILYWGLSQQSTPEVEGFQPIKPPHHEIFSSGSQAPHNLSLIHI